jgi:hypothetical protein
VTDVRAVQMITAIGVSLKKALEATGDNPQSEKVKAALQQGTVGVRVSLWLFCRFLARLTRVR